MIKLKFLLLISVFFLCISCKHSYIFIKKDVLKTKVIDFNFEKFRIPKDGYIYVKKGDTLYSIANNYQLVPKDIIDANNLKKPFLLNVNQKLYLPYPLIHKVKKYDTIYDLSLQYAVNQSDIVELNDLSKPYELRRLQKIKIPLTKDYTVIGLSKKIKTTKNNFLKKPIKRNASLVFEWPLKGKVIKTFGLFANGKQHYDGIDIEVAENKNVKASSDGMVAFVGSNIKSFGNMILIKHDAKWISAYTKLGKSMVSEGDLVKKGDVIGKMQNKKILHFQIRKSRNPVNPEKLLN